MNTFLDPVELSLTSKGKRFLNLLIDSFIYYFVNLYMVTPLLSILIISSNGLGGIASNTENLWVLYIIYYVFTILIYSLYFGLQEYLFKGRTIGKFITGTTVVTLSGENPTFKVYLIRALCRCIPFEPFSFFGDTGWHDSISKTRVVNTSDFMLNKIKYNSIDQIGQIGAESTS